MGWGWRDEGLAVQFSQRLCFGLELQCLCAESLLIAYSRRASGWTVTWHSGGQGECAGVCSERYVSDVCKLGPRPRALVELSKPGTQ